MVPSSFMISTIIAEGSSPARRARSHPASVCPARVSTPPGCAITGKMCPGCRRSSGRALGFTAVMTVCARSCAEMPVVTPSAASMDSVKLVRCSRCVSLTMSGRRSWRQRSAVSVRQMRPRPKRAMKLTSSAPHLLRGHDEVAFVFAILVVHDHHHAPGGDVGEDFFDAVERLHVFSVKPLDVASQQIDFQIDAHADGKRAERGDFERVRNEIHAELCAIDFVHGEAHAIERHRTLARDVTRQRFRRREFHAQRARVVRGGENFGDAIDMARHPVTTEAVAGAQRGLEIHARAVAFGAERGHAQRFTGNVGLKTAPRRARRP